MTDALRIPLSNSFGRAMDIAERNLILATGTQKYGDVTKSTTSHGTLV